MDNIFVVGISGRAGVGKSAGAEGLAPTARLSDPPKELPIWTSLYHAIPLYRMASIKQMTEGEKRQDRVLYQIHEVLFDLFGKSVVFGSLPNYDEFITLVKTVANSPCRPEGKPREFLQKTGMLCRSYNEDVFCDWLQRKIKEEYVLAQKEYGTDIQLGVVISDLRFPNEIEFLRKYHNNYLLKLTCAPEVVRERLLVRDGFILEGSSMASHPSETSMDTIPNDQFDDIMDTTELSIPEQVSLTKSLIKDRFNLELWQD